MRFVFQLQNAFFFTIISFAILFEEKSVHLKFVYLISTFLPYDQPMIPKRSMSEIQISSLYGLEFIQRLWPTNYHCQHLVSALITGATVERLKGLSSKPKKEIVFHTGKIVS